MSTLQIVVPLARRGSRFASAGYVTPKPLIPVGGRPMIQWVIENIRSAGRAPLPLSLPRRASDIALQNVPEVELLDPRAPTDVLELLCLLTKGRLQREIAALPLERQRPYNPRGWARFRRSIKELPECFNDEIYSFLREKANRFGMENLTYIREVAHSMKLNHLNDRRPSI
jgi:hypothetical protein